MLKFKPLLTPTKNLIKFLKQIDKNRYYSNFGPLYYRCKKLIENKFNLKKNKVVFTSSGHSSILACLYFIKNLTSKKYIITTSFNFFAAPQSIVQAGFIPYFIDINIKTLHYCEQDFINIPKKILNNLACIIIPSPMGMPIDIKKLKQLKKKFKCELIYDAADTFNNLNKNLNELNFFTVLSFHPTKDFGANESGLIICKKEYESKIENIISFGADKKHKKSSSIGFNGKFSEYDAAIFLANYFANNKFQKKIKKNSIYFRKKFYNLKKKDIILHEDFGNKWFSSKICFISKKLKFSILKKKFLRNGIEIFNVWSIKPMSYQKNFENIKSTKLSNTKKYADKIFGISINKNYDKKELDLISNSIDNIFK
jgi:dTDP-4-amino-4,6-dideoxygalactose transaminase